jgi:hypothetical protein
VQLGLDFSRSYHWQRQSAPAVISEKGFGAIARGDSHAKLRDDCPAEYAGVELFGRVDRITGKLARRSE